MPLCRTTKTGEQSVLPEVRVVNRLEVDDDGLAALLIPRDDLVLEEAAGDGVFTLGSGPFESYRRTVTATPLARTPSDTGESAPSPALPGAPPTSTTPATIAAPTRHQVEEVVELEVAIPLWGALFRPLVRRTVRRSEAPPLPAPGDPPRQTPWWSPPARLDARAAQVLSRLCGLSMLAGYLGTILTQTITFASDDFHATTAQQGATLAGVRFGVLFSLVLLTISDRRGRKRLLVVASVGGAVAAASGALAPNLAVLGVTQTVSRSFSTTLVLLITVLAAEEMPAGGRAYAASVLSMTAALGAGGAVLLLPLADVIPSGWRVVYVAPLLALPLFLRVARRLPESRRFARPHAKATMAGHRHRLALLAASAFFGLVFLAPVTQFQNDFLRDEHHFSALGITIFTIFTNTPGGIGIVIGGKLADLRGRRPIGAVGVIGGAVLLTLGYQVGGPALWAVWIVGTIVAAMSVPALSVYGPELFPTSLRAKANGIITLAGVTGGGVGLLLAGRFADRYDRFGPGFVILAAGPMVVALLVITLYPETANLELEELNPEDAPAAAIAAAPVI